MRRGLSFFVSIAILAAAGWLAWRLVVQPRSGPPGPAPGPGDATPSRPVETRPETRRIVPVVPLDERPLASSDRIEGTIYDEGSRPVGDATVEIISFTYVETSTRPLDRRFEDRTQASTVSGDDGRFSFTGLVPGEPKVLRVSKPGFVTQMKDGLRVPARRDFTLVPGARVAGRVIDAATQQPIGSVGIKGWYPASQDAELPAARAFRWKEEVFTNSRGEYVFEGAPSGMVKFMLTHPEYEDVAEDHRVRLDSANVLGFRMKPALVVEGTVIHQKKDVPVPVADIDVAAFDSIPLAVVPRWKTRTDARGRFRLAGVKSGPVRFEISGRGFSPTHEVRELTEAENFAAGKTGKRLEFRVVPAGRIAGRVTSAAGEPLVRARIFVAPVKEIFVVVRDPRRHGGTAADGEVRTDATGGFLVDDITGLPHRLVADAPGFALGTSEPVQAGPDEIKEGVNIVLSPAPAIRGIVTEEGRGPVAGATVTAEVPQFGTVMFPPGSELGQKTQRTASTDPGGGFRVELPYAGKFKVTVDHPEFVVAEGVEVALEEGQIEATQDFTLKRALAVAGTVTGPSGKGEPGAVVKAWLLPSGTLGGEARTDDSGAYSIPRLQAGSLYRVAARKAESDLTSAFRDEVPAGSAGIDFRLVRGGEIVGTVTNASGTPVPEFQVVVQPVGGRVGPRGSEKKKLTVGLTEREEAVKDAGGIFRIARVDPGPWSVQIFAPSYAPSTPVEVAVEGDGPVSAGTIVVTPGGAVSGRITGPAGEPVEGIAVSLTRFGKVPDSNQPLASFAKPWSGRTGADGQYSAKGLLPGEYMLRVESPRFVDPPQERLVIREGDELDRPFKLKLAAAVTVVVKDEVREPVPSAIIFVIDGSQRRVFAQTDEGSGGTTDANGRAVLRKLPAGEPLIFRAVRAGFFAPPPEPTFTLPEGESGPIDLKLERAH
jgi:Carboxypeptidase regulatory-like domain